MKIKSAREWALHILLQYEQNQAYSNLLLHQSLEQSQLSTSDKRLVTELVYGCIQRMNTLDWVINQLVTKGIESLQPWVRQVLRLGIYQLKFLDRIPERAAVHETVKLAKQKGHKGVAGLVNGVLRSYLRNREKWQLPSDPTTIQEMALAYSHPKSLVKRFVKWFGQEDAKKIMQTYLQPPKVAMRVNRLKIDRTAFQEKWEESEAGQLAPSAMVENGVILDRGGNPANSPLFQQGYCTIQDESSMLVAHIVDPKPGQHVLDACAAPGGKTTHIAELMGNQGRIVACDIHVHKIGLIASNCERLGIDIVETHPVDARKLPREWEESFDAILLDAPCSGLGVIRRKPDIKWNKELAKVDSLLQLQRELLQSVSLLLKPGGVLVYSTCTLDPRENQEQVEQFLHTHPQFTLDSQLIERLPGAVKERALLGEGWVQILPHHFGSDGFFIARLLKQ
jgi:16S rRNA (cytosine967-C5)-methyltransferase